MLRLSYQGLITVSGEVHCGPVSQIGIEQNLGLKEINFSLKCILSLELGLIHVRESPEYAKYEESVPLFLLNTGSCHLKKPYDKYRRRIRQSYRAFTGCKR